MTEGRRETRKRTTRETLADAALRRFAADGYDQTSVEAIAADAGVSARTFFRYFATKDEVLDMGRQERQAELREVVASAPGTGLSVVEAAIAFRNIRLRPPATVSFGLSSLPDRAKERPRIVPPP